MFTHGDLPAPATGLRRGTRARTRRWAELLLVVLAMAPIAVIVNAPAASAVAPTLTVSLSGGGEVLAGEDASYSISATNTGATDGFNLALVLDVPIGVTFVSSSLGTPVIYDVSNPPPTPLPAGTVRWVWEDVSDLPASGTFGGSVTVHPTQPAMGTGETSVTTVFPVGSSFVVEGTAVLSGDPTLLPVFNGSTGVGGPVAIAETGSAGPDPVTTDMIALELAKSEPSPEAELLRGVHDQTTIYTLTIRNTSEGDTENAILIDHLPAGLEFLGCGAIDNSTVDWFTTADPVVNEYEGAADLTGTPFLAVNCPTPVTIDTLVADVTLAATYGLSVGETYTQVTWNLGTLAAGSTTTVRYRAAVPLYENTTSWGAAPLPTPGSLGQAANLDNNNGPSTRHGDPVTPIDGDTWTNVANIAGDYAGVVRTGSDRATTDRATETIYAMDLSILKGIAPADAVFDVGNIADFTLTLRASEYMDSSQIVVTDVLANGLCPLMPAGTPLTEIGVTVPAECLVAGTVSGAEMIGVTAYADGTFEIVFRPILNPGDDPDLFVLAANDTHDITYEVLNRDAYELAPNEYGPTTSGDGFGNTVSFVAVTDAITRLLAWFPPTWNVWDDSGASIASDLTTITKRVLPRSEVEQDLAPGVDPCTLGTFVDGPEVGFRLGDTVCFELTVNFPNSIDVRNPVVTDFLPDGMTYVGYDVVAGSVGPIIPTELDASAGRLQWELGTLGAGGDLYVPRGSTFVAHLWATVDAPSSGPILDKPENLMKYRQQNVDGVLYFLRDEAAIEVDPELELIKGVLQVEDNGGGISSTRSATSSDDPDGTTFASNRDGILVREGEVVTYRVDLRTMPYAAEGAEVWDALPAGISAADVSNISDLGVVYDPSDGGYPAGIDPSLNTRSVVIWDGIDVPYDIGAGEARRTLTYDVTIPVGTAVATTHDNEASIISYLSAINSSSATDAQVYYPTDSFDVSASGNWNTPGTYARDDSNIYLPSATISKTVTSPLDTNNTATQAVKGEIFHFTYSVTVPARTSILNGSLTDAFVNPQANWSVHNTLTTVDYPGGSTAAGDASFTLGADTFTVNTLTGQLTFPALYTNTTDSDQVFSVNLYVHVTSGATFTHNTGTRRNDTASFSSSTQSTITATSGIFVIAPLPTIVKSVNDTSVTAGQTVTYTLSARNNSSNSRPTSYDTQVIDCIPAQLTGVTLGAPTQGSASIIPDVSCSGTRIVWDVGALLSGSANYETLSYTATVSPSSAGLAVYTNSVGITGYSLDDPSADRAAYTASTTASVTVLGAGLTKGIDFPTATVGQERTYTVSGTIPADVNFYDSALIDNVPAGLAVSGIAITCTYGGGGDCLGDLPGGGAALTPSGTLMGWWLGDITSNPDTRTISLTYTGTILDIPGNVNGTALLNTAVLRWNTTNAIVGPPADASYTPNAATSTASATVTVVEPNVTVSKLVEGAPNADVAPGDTFSYAVTATNGGTSTAYDLTVRDVVPTGVVVNAGTISDGGSISGADPVTGGGTITWTLASLAVGAPSAYTFTYDASLAPSATLTSSNLTNTASVPEYFSHPTGAGYDTDERRTYVGGSDTAYVTPIFPIPTITKTSAVGPAYFDTPHGFTIRVDNDATATTATSATVLDTLPADWSYDLGSTLVNGVAAGDPAIAGQDLTWSGLPDLDAGEFLTIEYTASPSTSAATGSAFLHNNSATVNVDDTSGAPRNFLDFYTDTTTASAQIDAADIEIDKQHSGTPTAGSDFDWTLTVWNHAASDTAVGPVVITDTLPAGATYVGVSGTGWSGSESGGIVTLTHAGPIAANIALPVATVTVHLPASLGDASDFTNSASVLAETFDPDLSNNSDDDPATTVVLADVWLTKSSVGPTFVAGEDITWVINVGNLGPSVAPGSFVVTDTLPSSVDWDTVVAGGTGWSCDPVTAGGELVCTWNTSTLDVGEGTDTLTVTARVLASWVGTVDNTATVTHPTTDPDPDNNTDLDVTGAVDTNADLSLTKTTLSVDIPASGTGLFRIDIANAGPSDALDVTVLDQLPAGLTYSGVTASAAGDTWDCIENLGDPSIVDCALTSNGGVLPLGATTWFELEVTSDASVTGAVLNVATVSSTTPDPDGSNNTDDSTTTPILTVTKDVSVTEVEHGGIVTYAIAVTSTTYGSTNDVTVFDDVPDELRIISVTLDLSSDPTVPDWVDPCVLADQDAEGYGGTITCVLGGDLARGRVTPTITVTAQVDPDAPVGTVLNVAEVSWTDPMGIVLGTMTDVDDAVLGVTLTDAELAATGAGGIVLLTWLAALLVSSGSFALWAIRRREPRGATSRP